MSELKQADDRINELRRYYQKIQRYHDMMKCDIDCAREINPTCKCCQVEIKNLIENLEKSFARLFKLLDKMINNNKLVYASANKLENLYSKIDDTNRLHSEKSSELEKISTEYNILETKFNQKIWHIKEITQEEITLRRKHIKELHEKKNLASKNLFNFKPKNQHETLKRFKDSIKQDNMYDVSITKKYLSVDERKQFETILEELLPLIEELKQCEQDDKIPAEELWTRKIDASGDEEILSLRQELMEKKSQRALYDAESKSIKKELKSLNADVNKTKAQLATLSSAYEILEKNRQELENLLNKHASEFDKFSEVMVSNETHDDDDDED